MRVLVVDDNSLDVRLVRRCLVGMAQTVDGAATLSSALECLAHSVFDLILLDLTLPDAGPDDALTTVLEAAAPTPVVVLTGLADPARAREVLERGAAGWICKDRLDGAGLQQSIQALLDPRG